MMAGDAVEFCKGSKLREMEGQPPKEWALKWSQRIGEHYLNAAAHLNDLKQGFASVALQCSAIEAIGTIEFPTDRVGDRFEKTAQMLLGFAGRDATLLYKHYRCGLIHNGRTNQVDPWRRPDEISGISYELGPELYEKAGRDGCTLIVVSPVRLLESICRGFDAWFNRQDLERLGSKIEAEFREDIGLIKKIDA